MSKKGRYLVELAMESKIETFNDNQSAYGNTNNGIEKYGYATDRKMIPVEMRQSNEILDKITTNETNCEKPVSPKVFTELQPFCEGNTTDRKMITVEMRHSNEIIDENATNETNSKKPVSPKVFTELQPFCEEYLEDSPVDDSDVDPEYKPSDEKQKNTKKLTFLARKRKISNNERDYKLIEDEDENKKKSVVTQVKKKTRIRTESEKRKRNLQKYQLLSECNCKKRCFDFFSNDERKSICESLWRLNFGERRQYLNACVKKNIIQQRRTGSNNKRQWSLTYSMIKVNEGTEKNVCKTMLLHTHGLKTDGMITELKRHQNKSKGLQIAKDGRGKGTPPNKKDGLIFKDHINSFNPQVSYYKLVHAPNRDTFRYKYNRYVERFL
ncbi:unnamed protein product [Psylliodes chrysocephalus]|uniref:Uncharacterized protein n=1 Tax=Psylliodes chrysocephalus TaxID=3402493 RepID=A0A9P0GAW0_9CUCU|nr:unnamed protein product [Psylliodes chrysocephala]